METTKEVGLILVAQANGEAPGTRPGALRWQGRHQSLAVTEDTRALLEGKTPGLCWQVSAPGQVLQRTEGLVQMLQRAEDQRTAGWNASLRIGAMKNSFAISRPLAAQKGSLRSTLSGAMAEEASAALRAWLLPTIRSSRS